MRLMRGAVRGQRGLDCGWAVGGRFRAGVRSARSWWSRGCLAPADPAQPQVPDEPLRPDVPRDLGYRRHPGAGPRGPSGHVPRHQSVACAAQGGLLLPDHPVLEPGGWCLRDCRRRRWYLPHRASRRRGGAAALARHRLVYLGVRAQADQAAARQHARPDGRGAQRGLRAVGFLPAAVADPPGAAVGQRLVLLDPCLPGQRHRPEQPAHLPRRVLRLDGDRRHRGRADDHADLRLGHARGLRPGANRRARGRLRPRGH